MLSANARCSNALSQCVYVKCSRKRWAWGVVGACRARIPVPPLYFVPPRRSGTSSTARVADQVSAEQRGLSIDPLAVAYDWRKKADQGQNRLTCRVITTGPDYFYPARRSSCTHTPPIISGLDYRAEGHAVLAYTGDSFSFGGQVFGIP